MAASMSFANSVRGKCQKILHTMRFMPGWLHSRPTSTDTESEFVDFEFDEQELEEKIAKIRDCSKLNKAEKLKHNGKMPEQIFSETYHGNKRNKLRKLYAEYGSASGINPGIMYPSRAELGDLWDVENNWTHSFQQMQKNLEEKKAAEALAARLRDENINKAMEKMGKIVKQYHDKQKKGIEDEQRRDKTESLLEEFRETYGFSVKADSVRFRAFRKLKSEELKMLKAKQKKDEKKATSIQNLKKILAEKASQE